MVSSKYEPAVLPTREHALTMAEEREAWAKAARERDQPGSAREFELIALLLRFYAEHIDDAEHIDVEHQT